MTDSSDKEWLWWRSLLLVVTTFENAMIPSRASLFRGFAGIGSEGERDARWTMLCGKGKPDHRSLRRPGTKDVTTELHSRMGGQTQAVGNQRRQLGSFRPR